MLCTTGQFSGPLFGIKVLKIELLNYFHIIFRIRSVIFISDLIRLGLESENGKYGLLSR